jgi:hypothetical protein
MPPLPTWPLPTSNWGLTKMTISAITGVAYGEAEPFGKVAGLQIAGVDAFVNDHARIVAQLPIQLAVTDIDGVHAGGSALQQAIGEAAGGGSHVQADATAHVDREMIQRAGQLEPAAADVGQRLGDLDSAIFGEGVTGLVGPLAIDSNAAGEDQSSRLLARIGEAPLHQDLIQTSLHGRLLRIPAHDFIGELLQTLTALIETC